MDKYVCVVTNEVQGSLVPLLSRRADKCDVVLLVQHDMQRYVSYYLDLIRQVVATVELVHIAEHKYHKLRTAFSRLFSGWSDNATAQVNCTGAESLVLLALQEACSVHPCVELIHVDLRDRCITSLTRRTVSDLPACLTVPQLLLCGGYTTSTPVSSPVPKSLRMLCSSLVDHAAQYATALGTLNYYAAQAERRSEVLLDSPIAAMSPLWEVVHLFQQAGLLKYTGNSLVFESEENRLLVNGGWLEAYVHSVVYKLHCQGVITDYRVNAVVCSANGTKNELDIVFSANNILFVIECKTANLMQEKGAVPIYKLKSLIADLSGEDAEGMLVCYRNMDTRAVTRCEEYDMALLQSSQLANLEETLRNWIEKC